MLYFSAPLNVQTPEQSKKLEILQIAVGQKLGCLGFFPEYRCCLAKTHKKQAKGKSLENSASNRSLKPFQAISHFPKEKSKSEFYIYIYNININIYILSKN